MTNAKYDSALTFNTDALTRRKLKATSLALGLSGEGEVIRSVLDGRLPSLDQIPAAIFRTQRQHDVYRLEMEREDA